MACINKSAFLKPLRLKTERYPLPEYGEDAYVVIGAMTSKDLLALQELHAKKPDVGNLDFAYDVLARSLLDDAGNRLFADREDAKASVEVSIPALEALVEKCLEVSGVRTEEKN